MNNQTVPEITDFINSGEKQKLELKYLNLFKLIVLESFKTDWLNKIGIHQIECVYENNKVTLTVTAQFPGIFIGKGGENIKRIIEMAKNDMATDNIEVKINESTLWKIDYEIIKQ